MMKQCVQVLSFDTSSGCIFNFYLLVFSVQEVKPLNSTFSMFYSQYSVLTVNRQCFLLLPSWYAGIWSEVYIKILAKLVPGNSY